MIWQIDTQMLLMFCFKLNTGKEEGGVSNLGSVEELPPSYPNAIRTTQKRASKLILKTDIIIEMQKSKCSVRSIIDATYN